MVKQKTVKMLIIDSIKSNKRPQTLKRIYDKVKKFRPETLESTVRGRINESILKNENLFKRLGGGVYDIIRE